MLQRRRLSQNPRRNREFPSLHVKLNREMACVTTQELEDMYPDLPEARDREDAFLREHGSVIIGEDAAEKLKNAFKLLK